MSSIRSLYIYIYIYLYIDLFFLLPFFVWWIKAVCVWSLYCIRRWPNISRCCRSYRECERPQHVTSVFNTSPSFFIQNTSEDLYLFLLSFPVASPGSGAMRRGIKLHETFVAYKMTRNNTGNKVHVAATELPQLLSQNTNMFGEATAQSRCQTLCSSSK